MHQIKSVKELLRDRLISSALVRVKRCGSIIGAGFYGCGVTGIGAGVSVSASDLVGGSLVSGALLGGVLVGGCFIQGVAYAGTGTDSILEFSFDIAEDDLNRIVLPFRDAEVSTISTAEIKNENGVLYVLPADKKPVTLFAQSAEEPLLALKLTLVPKGGSARAITVPDAVLRSKPVNQNMNNFNKSSNSSPSLQKDKSGAASTPALSSNYSEPMSYSEYLSVMGSGRDDKVDYRGDYSSMSRGDASSRNLKNARSWPEHIRPALMYIWSRLTTFPEANLYRESIFVRPNDNSRGPNSLNGSGGSRGSDTSANPQKGNYTIESKDILFEGENAVIKHFYELGPGFSEEPEGLRALRNTRGNTMAHREGTFHCELLRPEQAQYTIRYKDDLVKASGSDAVKNTGEQQKELTLVEAVESDESFESDYRIIKNGLGIIEPLASVFYQGEKVHQGGKLGGEASGLNREHSFDENFLYTLMYAQNDSAALVIPSCSGSGFRFLSLLNRRGIPPHTGRLFIVVTAR